MSDLWVFIAFGVVALVLGIRGSVRLTTRYRDVAAVLVPRERLLLLALVVVAWTITIAAAYFMWLGVRRLAGEPPFEWSPLTSTLVASVILFIPAFLDYVVERVARVPRV